MILDITDGKVLYSLLFFVVRGIVTICQNGTVRECRQGYDEHQCK